MDRLTRRTLIGGAISAAFFPAPLLARSGARTVDYGPAKLDIYPASEPKGALVFFHGGSWRRGSRRNLNIQPEWFNALGLTFVSADYPVLSQTPVRGQIDAVRQAIDWSFKHVAPPDNTVVMGHSAGAHLAAMATVTGWPPLPAGVILNDTGAVDLITLARANRGHLPRGARSVFKTRESWAEMSPAYHLGRQIPPILGIWSRAHGHAMAMSNFATNVRGKGGSITLFDASHYSHGKLHRDLGRGKMPDFEQAIARFIREVL